jgi:pilus assembly protein Flp/PilA
MILFRHKLTALHKKKAIKEKNTNRAQLNQKLGSEAGQGLTEYAVLVSLVAIACIAVMALFGGALRTRFSSMVATISGQSTQEVHNLEVKAGDIGTKAAKQAGQVGNMKTTTDGDAAEIIDEPAQ